MRVCWIWLFALAPALPAQQPDNSTLELDGARHRSFPLPQRYRKRFRGRRELDRPLVTNAIACGLAWLVKTQGEEDGRWKATATGSNDVYVTSLALLAFAGDGSTMRVGPYKQQLKRGVLWIKDATRTGGVLAGDASRAVRSHAVATAALAEVQLLSAYKTLKKYCVTACETLCAQQREDGSFPRSRTSEKPDIETTAWASLALRTMSHARLRRPGDWPKRVLGFLDTARDTRTTSSTAAALYARLAAGATAAGEPTMAAHARAIARKRSTWKGVSAELFFATYSLREIGGDEWRRWQSAVCKRLIKNQRTDGKQAGSWDPPAGGDRTATTALALLCLESYYR